MASNGSVPSSKDPVSAAWLVRARLRQIQALFGADLLPGMDDDLEHAVKAFHFYYLLAGYPSVTTVAGPQGVGKSHMVNMLLQLPERARLPTGEGRCERVPVILLGQPSDGGEVRILRTCADSADPAAEDNCVRLSYEDGRRRLVQPEREDVLAFWHVPGNPILDAISPLVVLPGLELGAGWSQYIRAAIDVSDLVVATFDQRRLAQASTKQLNEWLQDADTGRRPVLAITKKNLMSADQQNQVRQLLADHEVILVDREPGEDSGYGDLLEKLGGWHVAGPTAPQRGRRARGLIRRTGKLLDDLLHKVGEAPVDHDAPLVDATMDRLDEAWREYLKAELTVSLDGVLEKRAELALKNAQQKRGDIFKGTGRRMGIWFRDCVRVSDLVKLEEQIRGDFDGLQDDMRSELESSLRRLASPDATGKPSTVSAFGDLSDLAVIRTMFTRSPQVLRKDASDLVEALKKGGAVSEQVGKLFVGTLKDAREIANAVSELRRGLKDGKSTGTVLAAGVAGTVGAGQTALEAAGGGVAGLAPSVALGVAGAAVAVIAATSVAIMILRASHRHEWEVKGYLDEYVRRTKEAIRNSAIQAMDRAWQTLRYRTKTYLRALLGADQPVREKLEKAAAIQDARAALRDLDEARFA